MRIANYLIVLLSCLCFGSTVDAKIWRVALDGSEEYSDLSIVAEGAQNGDVIVVSPGDYVVSKTLDIGIVTVCGIGGKDETTIRLDAPRGQSRDSVFRYEGMTFGSELVFMGVTIQGGGGTEGEDGKTHGGAIYAPNSQVRLIDCELSRNAASGSGGALFCRRLIVVAAKFEENFAGERGGAISVLEAEVSDARFLRNHARLGGAVDGRAGESRSAFYFERSLFASNWAEESGGAFYSDDPSARNRFVNCVAYANRAEVSGGAFYLSSAAFWHLTATGNLAAQDSVIAADGRAEIFYSILWDNSSKDAGGKYQFSYSVNEASAGESNLSIDPMFVARGEFDLQRTRVQSIAGVDRSTPDFVVVEPDLKLLTESPAMDYVPRSSQSLDLAQNVRPCGERADAGAFETGDCMAPLFSRGDYDGDGLLNLTDAVAGLQFLMQGGAAPVCMEAADINNSGSIDISDPIYSLNFQFLGGPPPPAPGVDGCGPDLEDDGLGCAQSTGACL